MGCLNLRSLLVAVIFLSNCITWTASRHHFTHNASGHRSRHRRQGAGLYHPVPFVVPGGEGGGPWGEWGEASECSRTCGGGVATQKRICLQVEADGRSSCSGGDTKHFSCNTQDCPEDAGDFRAEQCSQYDTKPIRNNYYKWIPYTSGPKPCELNCMPRGERFYYRHQVKVIDGTRCNTESLDICVDGTCQPVGCDMMLGSDAKEDKCRVCRGNGTNCHTTKGLLDSQDLIKGYNDLLLIPQGATSIYIAEIRDSNNYLALRSKNNEVYYLNGHYRIDFPQSLMIAGSLWHYERSLQGLPAPDILRSSGPTNESLYLSLLLQDDNVGIEYEYSLPSALAPPTDQIYDWANSNFSSCSATCGTGFKTRNVTCRSRDTLDEVDDSLCDGGLKPSVNESCNEQECLPQWVPGPWTPCSKPCGEGGNRSREVQCQKIFKNSIPPSAVANKECYDLHGPPVLHEECNKDAICPMWFTGPWKPCDKLLGQGKQTRQVVCYQKTNARVEVLDDNECTEEKPESEKTCMLHPEEGIDWVISEWTECISKKRTRVAECWSKEGEVVDRSLCSYHSEPVLEEDCEDEAPVVEAQWYATQWGKCSVECGKGVSSRQVFCGELDESDAVVVVNDSKCDNETRYNDTKPCEVPKEKCPAKWFAGPWSECSMACNGGTQFRRIVCLSGGKVGNCSGTDLLDEERSCNTQACHSDEILPVDSSSTPIMEDEDDYDYCDDYEDEDEDEDDGKPANAEEETETPESTASTTENTGSTTEFTGSTTEFTGSTTEFTGSTTEFTGSTTTEESTVEGNATTEEGTGSTIDESNVTAITEESSSSASSLAPEDNDYGDGDLPAWAENPRPEGDEVPEKEGSGTTSFIVTETEFGSGSETTWTTEGSGSESTDGTETTVDASSITIIDTDITETGSTVDDSTVTMESGSTATGTDATPTGTTSTEITTEDSSTTTEETTSDSTTEAGSTSDSTTEAESDSTTSATTITEETDSTTNVGSTDSSEITTTDETGNGTDITTSTEIGGTQTTIVDVTGSTEGNETESTVTDGTAETSVTDSNATESSSTESTGATKETSTEGSSGTESEGTESTGGTGSTNTEGTGSTESTGTESTVTEGTSTESNETESTATESTGSTETGETSSGTESGSTQTTESGATEGTGSTVTEVSGSEETSGTDQTTPWVVWSPVTKKSHCKPRKSRPAKCIKSMFGCCPDKKTPAAGPFDEGCRNATTCKETEHGCCPDGVSPAEGRNNKGCPKVNCTETLFGCCRSDNSTPAEGNDQEGCPPPPEPCKSSKYGCCKDGKTEATGKNKEGCPETTKEPSATTAGASTDCKESQFGCCFDNKTQAGGANGTQCPCHATEFGCCPDGVTPAAGSQMEGCVKSCNTSAFGCCSDGLTPAHGPDYEGCCLLHPFGCCPDNYRPADGPHLEGCGCQYARFGCCPDNTTIARGPNNEGCGCQYTENGCCPDRHTEASGPEFEGCGCSTYQFGCCPDGVTVAKGPGLQGCDCRQSEFGCCGDGQTAAAGPEQAGCNCASSRYGCCLDGSTEAKGEKFLGCAEQPENKQEACALASDRGADFNYTVYWFYDMQYGGCSRFWYGGAGGNGNRFTSEEECEDVCVHPSPKDACNLPMSKGACTGYYLRWYYDATYEQCRQFVFGGCLGNDNNFESAELCTKQCQPAQSNDICKLPTEQGRCAGNYSRWGFSEETGRCEQFLWGGCEGNPNRFLSEAACMLRCKPPGALEPECSEPQQAGACEDKQPAWSFSATENRCVPFYYSGCGGNRNRFQSERSCKESCPSAFERDACTLPAEVGDCANYRAKWYYDTSIQRCRQFYYGGCGGNGNNFATEQECQGHCAYRPTTTTTTTARPVDQPPSGAQEFCFLEKDPGPCSQFEERWAYDAALGACVPFQYGGCEGNRNSFPNKEYCQYYCNNTQDICQLPMRQGPCDESLPRWFYDSATDSCSQFTYGGCEGNDNRFDSPEACEARCRSQPAPTRGPSATPAPESLPAQCAVSGLEQCAGAGRVWYWEARRGECVAHDTPAAPAPAAACASAGVWSSPEACERTCGAFRNIDVCRQPKYAGPCTAFESKYYFDTNTGSCLQFLYGGCNGGPNRFSTIDECESVCLPERDPCKQAPAAGNCEEYLVNWYYDESRDDCNQFVYTGCNGNGNRFQTREDCEGQCKQRAVPQNTTTPQQECQQAGPLAECAGGAQAFYYDAARGACARGAVAGCGHAHTYRTEEECRRRCSDYRGQGPGDNEVIPAGGEECESRERACAELQCPFGRSEARDADGCNTCTCLGHPCESKVCPASQRCVALPYRDYAQQTRYNTTCNTINKPGTCPSLEAPVDDDCRRECNDDADCLDEEKCCARGCGHICVTPEAGPPGPPRANPDAETNVNAQEGGTAVLRCLFHSNPPPKISWRRGEITISDGVGRYSLLSDGALQIVSLYHNDTGVYVCIADNGLGSAQQEIYLQVDGVEDNEVIPAESCDSYLAECSALRCEWGVQRTRTAGGCERCACVPRETDCEALKHDCEILHCQYGKKTIRDDDGCIRCTCYDHPCSEKVCPAGERCVAYIDPISRENVYNSYCRPINKPGACPATEQLAETGCRRDCNDDADCRGEGKCCTRGCSQVCIAPASPTSPAPRPDIHAPELEQAPQASAETEPEVNSEEGGVAVLRCLFHSNPPPKISWSRNEITINSDAGRYRLLSDGALEIVSLYRNDSGVYICVADNGLGVARQEIRLQVNDPVERAAGISGEPDASVIGEIGRPVRIRCLVYGFPVPSVMWYHGQDMVPYSNEMYECRGNELLIRALDLDALGVYTCQVYNGIGRPASWDVTVRAYQPEGQPGGAYLVPRAHVVAVTPRRQPAPAPAPATTARPPYVEYPEVAVYTAPVSASISAASTTLLAGAELSVSCDVDGHPEPRVSWTKDGAPLQSSDRIHVTAARVLVRGVALADAGEYACEASNGYSRGYASLQITVQEVHVPETCTDSPFFAKCSLIVSMKICNHPYYSKFCCKSCVEAGQLDPYNLPQSDQAVARK